MSEDEKRRLRERLRKGEHKARLEAMTPAERIAALRQALGRIIDDMSPAERAKFEAARRTWRQAGIELQRLVRNGPKKPPSDS